MLNDVEITQYTGLTDKNGVEIYEGDIIKQKYHWPYNYGKDDRGDKMPEYSVGEVVGLEDECAFYVIWSNIFHGDSGGLYGKKRDGDERCQDHLNIRWTEGLIAKARPIEIIGNSYRNQELLHA